MQALEILTESVLALVESAKQTRCLIDAMQDGIVLPVHRQVKQLRISLRRAGPLRLEQFSVPNRSPRWSVHAGDLRRSADECAGKWPPLEAKDGLATPIDIVLEEAMHIDKIALKLTPRAYRQRLADYGLRLEVRGMDGPWHAVVDMQAACLKGHGPAGPPVGGGLGRRRAPGADRAAAAVARRLRRRPGSDPKRPCDARRAEVLRQKARLQTTVR